MADSSTADQVEHGLISTSLDLEQLDTNLFRSKTLFVPPNGRGVYGGQVISQATVAATNCVDPVYGLHSLHCYFLSSASSSVPILYYVERLREGRSYMTFVVRAVQNSKNVYVAMLSFHKPEPQHPFHQWSIPANAPKPHEVELDYDFYQRLVMKSTDPTTKAKLEYLRQDRIRSPIQCTAQVERNAPDGTLVVMTYMRARAIPKYDTAYQKCILGYMSDLAFMYAATRTLGLKWGAEGRKAITMTASLDHTIIYYSDDFDCSDWILYVVQSPRTGSGRGFVQGQMYAIDGTLIAITTQEGALRSGAPRPVELDVKNKL